MKAFPILALLCVWMSGCKPDLPVDPGLPANVRFLEVTGEWTYSATDVRLRGSPSPGPCTITGITLTLTKIPKAGAFTGRSTRGRLECTGELAFLSGPIAELPIDNGYTFNQFIAFDLGSPDWRHDGLVSTTDSVSVDSISGGFKLNNGGIEFEGHFRAIHRPDSRT